MNFRVLAGAMLALATISAAHAHGGAVFIPVVVPQAQILPAARTGNYAGIHTVAVVSAIGQTLTLQKAGLLLPHRRAVDITTWKLDEQVEEGLRHYLANRFTVANVPVDRSEIAKIPNGIWDYSQGKLRDYLAKLPTAGIDAFIVVRPDQESETPGLPGLAVVNNSDPVFTNPQFGWANFEIDVIDAHSLSRIAHAYSRIQLRKGTDPGFAAFRCGEGIILTDDLGLTDAQMARLHADFSNLLNVSLLETLRALDLVSLPGVGARSLVPIPAGEDPYAGIKSVAIVSALGDELHLDHLGGTVFSQTHAVMPAADWRLDSLIESLARQQLGRRFAIKDIAFDRGALLKADLFDSDGKLVTTLPGLAASADVDAYVVVLKQRIRRWNTDVGGLGLWNHTPVTSAGRSNAVYANYAVVVIDARSLKFLAARTGTVSSDYSSPEPEREIAPSSWPEQVTDVSPSQRETIHSGLVQLLDDSIPETLLRMGLTGMMISSAPAPTATAAQ